MAKATSFLAAFLAIVTSASGQENKNWFFGAGAGLTFNTTPPTALSGGQTTGPDNTTTISDSAGNLLFYTNGVTVWNKNHQAMPNGSNLLGHVSAGQCALIVPMPCEYEKYVIFHVTEFASPGHLSYSVVDMTLDQGLGDVVNNQKNISVGQGYTEQLCAYYSKAGNFFWILTHKWNSDEFVAFQLTSNTIATNSIVTPIGTSYNCGSYGSAHDAMGQLTISPDGSRVVVAMTCSDQFEVYDFDLTTGLLSNRIVLPGDGGGAWGTAFSPDNSKIFTNSLFQGKVYQYDISTYTQAAILASKFTLANLTGGGYQFGYMELGPDGKIYVARPSTNFLSVVHSPNSLGASCNFTLNGQTLGSNLSSHGISRIAYGGGGLSSGSIQVSSSAISPVCASQPVTLTAVGANSYTWSNGSTSATQVVFPAQTSTYSVQGIKCPVNAGTIVVLVIPPTTVQINVTPSATICGGQTVSLTASGAISFIWNNSDTSAIQVVTPSQTSTYSVQDAVCPSLPSTVTIQVIPTINVTLSATPGNTVCLGQTVTLTAMGATGYIWSNSGSGSTQTVSPAQTTGYTVTGMGCATSANLSITVLECSVGLPSWEQRAFIFPNPVKDKIQVNLVGMQSYRISNLKGQVLIEGVLHEKNNVVINVSELDAAVYLLELISEFDHSIHRFIKQE